MKGILRLLWSCAVLLGLAGCAVTPTAPVAPVATAASAWTGRLALSVLSDPPQSFSAGFELHGAAEAGELRLTSPFGQWLASAHWSASGAVLRRGNDVQSYPNMDELTYALTGSVLPLASLFQWLQGQPATVQGWQADLSQKAQGRIAAQRPLPAPPVHLRIVLE